MKTASLLLGLLLGGFLSAHGQAFRWVKAGQTTSTDTFYPSVLYGVAVTNGQLVATGSFAGVLDIDGRTLTSPIGYGYATGKWGANGQIVRLNTLVGYEPNVISADNLGNVYVSYTIYASDTFGATSVSVPLNGSVCVLVKLDPNGQRLWAVNLGSNHLNGASALPNGNGCVIGSNFSGTLSFPGQPPIGSQPSSTGNNAAGFLARFDASGACQWLRLVGAGPASGVSGIALDAASGDVVVCGGIGGGPITFGPGAVLTPQGTDGFVARYDPQGNFRWAQAISSPGYDITNAVTTDGAGNVFVCGRFGEDNAFNATATFGNGITATSTGYFASRCWPDGFLAKYDPQGTCQWVQTLRGADEEAPHSLATNQRGEVYLSGAAYGGVLFGGGAGTPLPAVTFGYQGFVAKYTGAGALRWLRGYGGSGSYFQASNYRAGLGIATDGAGRVYVCGAFMGNTVFGNLFASGPLPYIEYPYLAALDDNDFVLSSNQPAANPVGFALVAYPNPATGRVQLEWPPHLRPARLDVRDVLGRLLHTETVPPAATAHTLELTKLPRGTYLVQLQTANQQLTRRLVLE